MTTPTIQVTIVDSAGVRQTFRAGHVDLDCGCGSIDIRAGRSAFCRGFDHGLLRLDDGSSVTTLTIVRGMASVAGDALNVLCERATLGHEDWGEHPISPASPCNEGSLPSTPPLSPEAKTSPSQAADIPTNKQTTAKRNLQHMKTLTKTLLLTGILGLASLMTSCQTTSSAAPTSAVTCSKCKTVWVKRAESVGPAGKTGAYIALKSEKSMDCPDCESAAATFFKTGSLKHHCAHCGDTLTHCEAH